MDGINRDGSRNWIQGGLNTILTKVRGVYHHEVVVR